MAGIVILESCPYCQKHRPPLEIRRFAGNVRMCVSCYRQHEAALWVLSGLKQHADGTFSTIAPPPPECSECGLSIAELSLRDTSGDKGLSMTVLFESGRYRFLCRDCAAEYVPKRKELFKGTEYARLKGLE